MSFPISSAKKTPAGTGKGSISLHGKTTAVGTHKPQATKGNVSSHGMTAAIRTK